RDRRDRREDPLVVSSVIFAISALNTSLRSLWPLARGWNQPVEPEVHHHLPVGVLRVADEKRVDARTRRRPHPRRSLYGSGHRLIGLLVENRGAVVEAVGHGFDRVGFRRRLVVDRGRRDV